MPVGSEDSLTQGLRDRLVEILTDKGEADAFGANPRAYLAEHGLDQIEAADVAAVIPGVAARLGGDAASNLASYDRGAAFTNSPVSEIARVLRDGHSFQTEGTEIWLDPSMAIDDGPHEIWLDDPPAETPPGDPGLGQGDVAADSPADLVADGALPEFGRDDAPQTDAGEDPAPEIAAHAQTSQITGRPQTMAFKIGRFSISANRDPDPPSPPPPPPPQAADSGYGQGYVLADSPADLADGGPPELGRDGAPEEDVKDDIQERQDQEQQDDAPQDDAGEDPSGDATFFPLEENSPLPMSVDLSESAPEAGPDGVSDGLDP